MAQRITLESDFSASDGGLKNVSLITTGIEAEGHGIYLDEKTAETAMKKLLGRSVKSYLRHDGAGRDRLGNEIGFFSGIYRKGAQIKASAFEFLESFKKDSGAIADRLVEMAAKVPDQFGVSLVLEYMPVWVLADGSEVQASSLEAPAGAVRSVPSMRVLDVISADFVGRPAANPNGLLSVETKVTVDAATVSQPSTPAITMSEPAIATLSVTDHEAKIAELSAGHTAALEAKTAELSAMKAERDSLTAAFAAKDAEIVALKAEAAKVPDLTAKVADLEIFDARKLGVAPMTLGKAKLAAVSASLNTPAEKLAYYSKIENPAEKQAFRDKHWQDLVAAS